MAAWKTLLCDLAGNPLSDVSAIAVDGEGSCDLNGMASYRFRVPSGDDRVTAHQSIAAGSSSPTYQDGYPALNIAGGRRTLKLFQAQSDGTWALRFTGWLFILDEMLDDEAWTTVVALDAGARVRSLLARDANGATDTISFLSTDAGQIAVTLFTRIAAAIEDNIILGNLTGSPTVSADWHHKDMAEVLVDLAQKPGGFDFELQPLDRTDSKFAQLNLYYPQKGADQNQVSFYWGAGGQRNCSIRGVEDATRLVTRLTGLARSGRAITQTNAGVEAVQGVWERCDPFHEAESDGELTTYVSDRLALDSIPTYTYRVDPVPGLTPEPWKDFVLGDSFRLSTGAGQRQGGYDLTPRLHGFKFWPGTPDKPDRFRLLCSV